MRVITVRNITRQVDLGNKIQIATSLYERAVGLLFTDKLKAGEGLYISPCRSIHTFFMRYPIDVLFVDSHGKVLSQRSYHPWSVSGVHLKSQAALELPHGILARSRTRVGDHIEIMGSR